MKNLAAILVLIVIAGCTSLPEGAPRVSGISLSPGAVALEVDARQRLLVSGAVEGREVDVTHYVKFYTDKPAVALVDRAGQVRAVGPGEAVVTAKYGSHTAQFKLAVKPRAANQPLSFVNDVLPILSKAGCNAGSCHAKPEGQNGFKLSVFTYDPESDWREIVEDARGRRVFPAFPSESLFIKKATLAIPHEGGQRIQPGSESERVLLKWIRDGMVFQREDEPALERVSVLPAARVYRREQSQRLIVQAHYSDGSVRDVTGLADFVANDGEVATVDDRGRVTVGAVHGEGTILARYMGQVSIARITVPAENRLPAERYAELPKNNFIDELAHVQFERLGLFPSDLCTDVEFLRRASLDAIGRLPTPVEAKAFIDDPSTDKRGKLIERLLADPAYADHWANQWADLVRPNPDRAGLKSVYILDQWLRESFRANLPMDQFARAMVAASGSTHRFGPTVVYRDKRTPPELAKIFSQVFLGTRLECARCHNHPNEKWTQSDFYSLAAYFAQVKRKGSGVSPPISGGTEFFYHGGSGSVKHPVTGNILAPKPPAGPPAQVAVGADPRAALVDWIVRPDNPFFARAMVNRVWGVYFGRGLVNPVDDLRASNPAMNAALLDALATHFVKIKFDQKALIRTVMQSRLYQLSHTPNESNTADTRNFSRMYLRRLRAEVLMDAINDVTGVPSSFAATWPGARAIETWNFKISSEFLDAFGRPNSSSDPPCERTTSGTIVQALHLMHGDGLQKKITHAKGRARRLADSKKTVAEIADEVYLAALSRRPTKNETVFVEKFYQGHNNAKDAEDGENNRRTATEDFIWAIINSAEFVFNH